MVTVLVIGGGVVGPVLALYLQKKGYNPILFEKVTEPSNVGAVLAIGPNGMKALNNVGIDDRIAALGRPIKDEVWLHCNYL